MRRPFIAIPYWTPAGIVERRAEDWFLGDRLEFFWPAKRRRRPAPFNWRSA